MFGGVVVGRPLVPRVPACIPPAVFEALGQGVPFVPFEDEEV